ncbi:MAG: hypothetical protein JW759_00900 [Candidatus Coatesbacteria bacterium]|nr:hypothetical protein [Candidatus Coatesbacteria bacterium]
MEIRCPKCGHKFDPMGEVLVDCPCCGDMFDVRTLDIGGEAGPIANGASDERRNPNQAFSVRDLRPEDERRAEAPRSADDWQEPALDDNEFWAARQRKDVQDAVKYCASPTWRRMSQRDEQRRAGYSPGMFAFIAGLFLPGAGHFRLGRPARGAIFFLAVLLAGVITFFAVPADELPDFSGRGYPNLPPNIYTLIGSILSSKVKYTLLAVGTAHLISIIDLIVLLGIGDKPTPEP